MRLGLNTLSPLSLAISQAPPAPKGDTPWSTAIRPVRATRVARSDAS